MSNMFQAIGAGLATGAAGFIIGGPIGGLAGFGIGMFGASQGMRGQSGATGGALIGGLAGFALGGPIGAIAGGLLGGLGGKAISKMFKPKPQPPQQAPFYPGMMPGMMGGGMMMPGMMGGGMMMPGMMGGGMMMGGMMGGGMMMGGMMGGGMMMGGMMMPGGMMGGFGMAMSGGMYGSSAGYGMNAQAYQNPVQGGQLKQEAPGKPIEYTTSGGYKVNVNGHTINITDPTGKNTVKHWGDPHEDFNGKTIKDWEEKNRTLILGDGTKITMNADHPLGVVNNMSIYDGSQGIHIDNNKNQVTNVTFDPRQTAMMERMQPDGETSYLGYNRRGDYVYKNLYTQNEDLSVNNNYKMLAKVDNPFWKDAPRFPRYPGLFWM